MPHSYLIVDDSSVIRQTLEKMLRRFTHGEPILTAETSEEALEIFRKEQPDVVLMDIMLPDVDGDQTAQVIFNESPETRVVVITGLMEDDERVREMIMEGAFDFLQKPIHSSDVEELINLLEEEEGGAGRIK